MIMIDSLSAESERQILAEKFAKEALRGYFGDDKGFTSMDSQARKSATRRVATLLREESEK